MTLKILDSFKRRPKVWDHESVNWSQTSGLTVVLCVLLSIVIFKKKNKMKVVNKFLSVCLSLRPSSAPQSDRLTSLFILPLLRLWIMEIMAECLFSSSSFCFSFVSSWLFCSSRGRRLDKRKRQSSQSKNSFKVSRPILCASNRIKRGLGRVMQSWCLTSSLPWCLASFLACSVLLSSFLKTSTVSSRSLLSWSFSFTFSSSACSSPRRPDEKEGRVLFKHCHSYHDLQGVPEGFLTTSRKRTSDVGFLGRFWWKHETMQRWCRVCVSDQQVNMHSVTTALLSVGFSLWPVMSLVFCCRSERRDLTCSSLSSNSDAFLRKRRGQREPLTETDDFRVKTEKDGGRQRH